MLLSKTIQKWDEANNQALKVIVGDPHSISIVMAIYQNPSYYEGYYLKGIEVNMDVLGSITDEQNHAINIKIIDQGSSMPVVDK